MYSTCLFCARALGRNEVIEAFPVGRRLAFDAAKGRLWVVCPGCERWNLTPLEERWEAIEQCERLFRDTPLRRSTENVGFARPLEGPELVRIGRPQRPELAAWRYGRQLNRRYFRAAGWQGLGALGLGIATGTVVTGVVSIPAAMTVFGFGAPLAWALRRARVVERVDGGDARRPLLVTRGQLGAARIVKGANDTEWALLLRHASGLTCLDGHAAASTLGRLLVHLNRRGASEYAVDQAVRRLSSVGDAELFIVDASRTTPSAAAPPAAPGAGAPADDAPTLLDLDRSHRLALEMALHEQQERRALDGELAELERAWEQADEIARIADALFDPHPADLSAARLPSRRGDDVS